MKTTLATIFGSIAGTALLLGTFVTTSFAADRPRGIDKELFFGTSKVILTDVDKTQEPVSPIKGNNGVGNGIDPAPPGNPPENDGPGTSPGNPGNKGGTPGHGKR